MPTKTKHKLIIDTNLWISFLLTRDFQKIDSFYSNKDITLIFSHELLNEFVEVANRPKFKNFFSFDDLEDLFIKLRSNAEFIVVTSILEICRDPKDNFLLALAQDGKATHLITGDKDLLIIQKIGITKILTISEYLSK